MANKVKFGLSNVHIAKITYGTDQQTGLPTITYGAPFALPGAVNLPQIKAQICAIFFGF